MIARSLRPTSPFKYCANSTGAKDKFILKKNDDWNAPGHNSVIQDKTRDF
jgi:hypothetical protein